MRKKKGSLAVRVSPTTKELLDEAKNYPEESYNKVIRRNLSSPNTEPAVNTDGRTMLEEEAYKSQMKQKGVTINE